MPLLPPKKSGQIENKISVGSIVEYEQHGQPSLGAVIGDRRDKWTVLNYRGAQIELPALRLSLLPGHLPGDATTEKAKLAFLDKLHSQADLDAAEVPLGDLWETVRGVKSEVSIQDLSELAFGDNTLTHHLAVRRAALSDRVYFKRLKSGLEPRSPEVVEELLVQVRVEEAKQRERETLVDILLRRIKGEEIPLPPAVRALERYAALGKSAEESKETVELIEQIAEKSRLNLSGQAADRAFQLLVAARHFTPDENLLFIRMDRETIFSEEVIREAESLPYPDTASRVDLRDLATYTIDADDTMDLDDAVSFERTPNGCRVGVHISDVSAWIKEGSLLEKEAFARATSIYTPDAHVPMLPPFLSQGSLSLIAGEDRLAVSIFAECDEHYEPISSKVVRSIIRVKERLSYRTADEVLFGEAHSASAGVVETLKGLWEVTCVCEAKRLAAGAIQFTRREMAAEIQTDGSVKLFDGNEETPSRKLVSEMMILGNESMAKLAVDNGFPLIFRGQEAPDTNPFDQGMEIPEGPAREYYQRSFLKRSTTSVTPCPHSGVGVEAYVQSTSPIRRAGDLLNQRQVSHFLEHGCPRFEKDELSHLLARLEPGLEEASLIQRERSRYFLLKYLKQEKLTEIGGTIVRTDGPKPLVELNTVQFIYPFHALGDTRNSEAFRKRRGERITLKIEILDPRRDALTVKEIQNT